MRIPNTECTICEKPIYRRPSDLKKVKFVSCKKHLQVAKDKYYGREYFKEGLSFGHGWNKGLKKSKGDDLKYGRPRKSITKERISVKIEEFCQNNPGLVLLRSKKISGENHYKWKGGVTPIRRAIRSLSVNQKWVRTVKERDDYKCVECDGNDKLEAHHLRSVSEMLEGYNITNHHQVKSIPGFFNIDNGITLCKKCHYKEHGRIYSDN